MWITEMMCIKYKHRINNGMHEQKLSTVLFCQYSLRLFTESFSFLKSRICNRCSTFQELNSELHSYNSLSCTLGKIISLWQHSASVENGQRIPVKNWLHEHWTQPHATYFIDVYGDDPKRFLSPRCKKKIVF